jgi:outer membrane lipoprotein
MKIVIGASTILALLILGSCAVPVIPEDIRNEAVPISSFADVRQNPEKYMGKTIITGGYIVSTINNDEDNSTLIILTFPLDSSEEPEVWKTNQGRLLVNVAEFLDPAIFASGRQITVAGTITGLEAQPLGKMSYKYIVMRARRIYLWSRDYRYYSYPFYPYPYWNPWYPDGYPWWPY